ncbi:hypothetical protein DID88_003180 [Monilinia fructigena]|uniref:Uncharacterized protein n=1 Tax=Monilinia fructigena TaxID=38457 RepID=A0A395IUQ0_9HELO|nr:hypothetical protein DID88_003180 [Monilinia fructigena]
MMLRHIAKIFPTRTSLFRSSQLSPRRGGPKNLPIAEVQIDDDDSEEMQKQKDKPKLVILGGGWGSVALLKTLNPDDYHITLVSPTNYFLFTPMLPSATVGTLEFRSLVEPIRRIITRVNGHFIRATAEEIEFSEKLVELAGKSPDGKEVGFYLPYDNGGGPTGVEFAAELFDLLNEDLTAHFPRVLRNEISVHVIQSRGHILNTYDEAVSKVQEVRPDKILFTQKGENGETVVKELPMGFVFGQQVFLKHNSVKECPPH